jgi:outer membrane protein assembly factor BamD
MNISRSLPCVLLFGCLSLAACSSHPDRDESPRKTKSPDADVKSLHTQLSETELRQEADLYYRRARAKLDAGDYTTAVTDYDKLIARYPFTDYGTQAEMEKAFALYKSYQFDDAAAAADHFLRDHPRHPRVDYVQYLKGLIEFDRNKSLLEALPIDSSKSDVTSARLSFNNFALLVQKYPTSRYVADARLRMIYLRNRIAQHELSIVRFYVRRGAYVAAAKRCEEIIATYPGAPATSEAAQLLEESYRKAGLVHEAASMQKLIDANPGLEHPVTPKALDRSVTVDAPASLAVPAADDKNSATAPQQQDHGLFSRFAGLFSIFDTTRPENSYTIVIPTGKEAPAAGDAASAGGASAATTAGAAGAAAATPEKTHHLQVSVGPESGEEWHPADQNSTAAKNASATTTPAAAAPATAASDTAPPATTPAKNDSGEKPGFFARLFTGFVNLFSFLDTDHGKDAASSSAPAK